MQVKRSAGRLSVLVALTLLASSSRAQAPPSPPSPDCLRFIVRWIGVSYETDLVPIAVAFSETAVDKGSAAARVREVATVGSFGTGTHATEFYPPARVLRSYYATTFCR